MQLSFDEDIENPDLVIEGFYDAANSELIGLAEDGNYYYYIPNSGEYAHYLTAMPEGAITGHALGGASSATPWWVGASEAEGFSALPWLVGLAGVGGAAVALGGGSSNNDNNSETDTTAPNAPTINSPIAGDDIVNGEEAEDGFNVTGAGEIGATITLTDNSDNIIGTATVDTDGNWSIPVDQDDVDAMDEGSETLTATATDPSGNTSEPTTINVTIDTKAPTAPTVDVNEDGTEITGTGEPGTMIEVDTDGDGEPDYTVTVDDNGDFAIDTSDNPLTEGETVTATATDPAGNTSEPGTDVAPDIDTTAPNAPTINSPIAGDDIVNGEEAEDGFNVTGTGEIGATITLTDNSDNIIGTATVDTDGNWSIPVDQDDVDAMDEGSETLTATATDPSGNTSEPTTINVTIDTKAPTAPTVDVNEDGTEITGTGEPGTMIEVDTDGDGEPDYTVTVDDNGDFAIDTSDNPLTEGETITATATDPAGNTSEPGTDVAPDIDTTAPNAPTINSPIAGDDIVNGEEAEDGFNVTGAGEIGATITLTDNSDNIIGTATVDTDGNWSIPVDQDDVDAMDEGSETLTATATDPSGNTSEPTSTDVTIDTRAPTAPTVDVNEDGTEITGTGEPGTTIEVALMEMVNRITPSLLMTMVTLPLIPVTTH